MNGELLSFVADVVNAVAVLVTCYIIYQFNTKTKETTDTVKQMMMKLLVIEERLDWHEEYIGSVQECLHSYGKKIDRIGEAIPNLQRQFFAITKNETIYYTESETDTEGGVDSDDGHQLHGKH